MEKHTRFGEFAFSILCECVQSFDRNCHQHARWCFHWNRAVSFCMYFFLFAFSQLILFMHKSKLKRKAKTSRMWFTKIVNPPTLSVSFVSLITFCCCYSSHVGSDFFFLPARSCGWCSVRSIRLGNIPHNYFILGIQCHERGAATTTHTHRVTLMYKYDSLDVFFHLAFFALRWSLEMTYRKKCKCEMTTRRVRRDEDCLGLSVPMDMEVRFLCGRMKAR
jgi:hypothetical protein